MALQYLLGEVDLDLEMDMGRLDEVSSGVRVWVNRAESHRVTAVESRGIFRFPQEVTQQS